MTGWTLAVDFGTVNTAAALRFADGRVDKVRLGSASDTMPSAVVVIDGHWRTGQSALNARYASPQTFVASPKTRLGQEAVPLGEEMVTPAQIASHVLAAVRERAVRAAGGTEPDLLVLTHPVQWGGTRLDALREAAVLAGFPAQRTWLLPEPIAALYAYSAPETLPPGSRVVVVDTGGGTCDVAVVQTNGPAPTPPPFVVAQEGDDRLGGNDLDDLLYRWVLDQLHASGRSDLVGMLDAPQHLGAALTLRDVVRGAKEDLSEHPDAPIGIQIDGTGTSLTITRDEYEKLIVEPMARVAALTARALRTSGTTHLAALYLTGGTASTPALARALHQVTGILAAPIGDPKFVVPLGALSFPWEPRTTPSISHLPLSIGMGSVAVLQPPGPPSVPASSTAMPLVLAPTLPASVSTPSLVPAWARIEETLHLRSPASSGLAAALPTPSSASKAAAPDPVLPGATATLAHSAPVRPSPDQTIQAAAWSGTQTQTKFRKLSVVSLVSGTLSIVTIFLPVPLFSHQFAAKITAFLVFGVCSMVCGIVAVRNPVDRTAVTRRVAKAGLTASSIFLVLLVVAVRAAILRSQRG